jgi:general stress protein 26
VVPVWYEWDGECVWIHTFWSTRKVQELQANQRLSVSVDADEPVRGVIFEGEAELIRDPAVIVPRANSIYVRYLGEAGAQEAEPQSWIHDAESTLIKLKPDKVHVWGLE